MKKYLILFVAALVLAAVIYSCTKVLNQNPKGALSSEALQNQAGGEAAVIACYSILNNLNPQPAWGGVYGENLYNPASNWESGDLRSGDCYKGGGGTGDVAPLNSVELGLIDPTNEAVEDIWRAYFYAVVRCNKTIQLLNTIPDDAFPLRQTRISEVKVLRGWFYYHLKLHYRTFPYLDENTPVGTEQDVPNNLTETQLWDKIIADFSQGSNLPFTSLSNNRVNKYVAYALLCKAYMFTQNYPLASNYADSIINSGVYHLQSDLQGLYSDPNQEDDGENIFSLAVNVQAGAASNVRFNWGDLWVIPPGPYGGGDGFDRPSQNLVNAFKVDANGLPLLDNFNDSDLSPANVTTPVDPRLDLAIGRPGITWKDYTVEPYSTSWARTLDVYGPYSKKKNVIYVNSPLRAGGTTDFPWAGGALNFPFLKISDIMLLKAEALIEMNQDLDQARGLINQIRQRAQNTPWVKSFGNNSANAANYQIGLYPSTGWTQDYARKAVRFERRLELCLEGQRFFDLVRWGITNTYINNYYNGEKIKRTYLTTASYNGPKIDYYPIPQTEIDLSKGVVKQDPNY
jgi:hypothetical protein